MMTRFWKYQALQNDYILFDTVDAPAPALSPESIQRLCHRRMGVGADGILLVSREDTMFRMEIINADGSVAGMCGNGLRCVGKFLADTGRIAPGSFFPVATRAGLRGVTVKTHSPPVSLVAALLGRPRVVGKQPFRNLDFWHVDVGNPHIVHFLPEPPDGAGLEPALALALQLGPQLEHALEGGVNVGFACIQNGELHLAVWERGAGFTEACGTGATAAVTAARAAGILQSPSVRVYQRGGTATVSWQDDEQAILEGDAHFVFSGNVFLDF